MPPAFHHVSIVTSEAQRLRSFLTTVLDMPLLVGFEVDRREVGDLLGWPPPGASDAPTTRSDLFGSGASGLVEVVELPGATAHPPGSGLVQVAVQVSHLDQVLSEARRHDPDQIVEPRPVSVAGRTVVVAAVVVAGVRFQLTESGN